MKRYPSGLITADPVTLGSSSNGYIVSSTDQLQYNFSGVWPTQPLPPFPTYTSLSYSNSFDGTGDYLSIPSNPSLAFGTGDFTVEAWVNWSSISAPRPIIDMQSSGSFNLYWDNGAFNVNSLVVSDRTANQIVYSFLPTIGIWYHIAVSRSGTNLRLFVNGILVSTAASNTTNYAAGISHIGGDTGTSWYHNGYISNLRVVKGQAVYTGNFTVPTSPLALTQSSSSNVASIINTIPSNGNSVYFDGTGDYLTFPGTFSLPTATTPFTIEAWVYFTAFTGVAIASTNWASSGAIPFVMGMGSGSGLSGGATPWFGYFSGSAWTTVVQSSTSLSLNQWYHLAYVYTGSSATIYANGVNIGTASFSSWTTNSQPNFYVGRRWDLTGSDYFTGYISNFRFTIGTAAYTGNFTTPTAPLAITQSASSNISAIVNTIPENDGSVYFDGDGDYLSLPSNTAFQMGTGDFTLECWVKIQSSSGGMALIDLRNGQQPSVSPLLYLVDGQATYYVSGAARISGATLNTFTWYHLAVVRSSSVTTLYVNGTASGSTYADTNDYILNAPILGKYSDASVGYLNGYLNNVRIVKGTAVYTSTFTPPTTSLSAISGTSLLTCQLSTIKDNSVNAFTITVNGGTRVALADSPFGVSNVKILTAQSPRIVDTSLANNTITVNGDAKSLADSPFGVSNVKLLTAQSPTVIDNSLNNFTTTVNGDTKALALSPFDTTLQTAYLAVAGGGGGGGQGGGGGAGGLLYRTNLILVPNVTYTITIGAGGTISSGSSFGSDTRITNAGFAANITAIGGGAGQSRDIAMPGGVGGSGGGGGAGGAGGNATGQAGTPGQGFAGGNGYFSNPDGGGGGGGGAGGVGQGAGTRYQGNGGIGVYLTISGSNVAYAGGGGGGSVGGFNNGGGAGGIGGGGGGSHGTTGGGGSASGTPSTTAAPGTYGPGAVNTGGGGGGGGTFSSGTGGSGIVILASNIYQASNVTGNPNVTYDYGNSVAIYRFWQSGTIKW